MSCDGISITTISDLKFCSTTHSEVQDLLFYLYSTTKEEKFYSLKVEPQVVVICKISAKIKGGERRKVLVSRILYLLSDITEVFFGKTTKNMYCPTPQSIKGCQRLIQFDSLLSKRWRVLMKSIKPIQKSLLGSQRVRQPDSFPTHSSSSASCRTKCSSNSSSRWENLH